MAKVIEAGDIYFFYRPKVDVDSPKSVDDVQRLHMILMPDKAEKGRLFVVGKKQMPEIHPGESRQSERQWIMSTLIAKPDKIGEELRPLVYQTKTRGKRKQGEAIPVGEGRYQLFEHEDSNRLAYKLSRPRKPGKVQDELRIQGEGSYIVSVRNPDLDVPGFPDEKPKYPKKLQEMFANERWLKVSDSKLLDYTNVQLVLIGARENLKDMKVRITGKPDLFGNLGIEKAKWPTAVLDKGEFAKSEHEPASKSPRSDRSKGGEIGGRRAVGKPSAAGVAKSLKGIDFPNDRTELISYAKDHGTDKEILDVLQQLPKRQFNTMADVQKALGEVR